jgi:hypothetical protein
MSEAILEAKKRLYFLLANLDEDAITDNEVDIMNLISKDRQIELFFENAKRNGI